MHNIICIVLSGHLYYTFASNVELNHTISILQWRSALPTPPTLIASSSHAPLLRPNLHASPPRCRTMVLSRVRKMHVQGLRQMPAVS